ncbi:MAG: tetratricopeptide repeat protein [Bacteroidota bacterium]
MIRPYVVLLFLVFVLAGCGGPSPEEMFARAGEAVDARDFPLAIAEFTKLVEAHPESEQAEVSMFTIATIYNNELHEFDKAIEAYKKYLSLNPDGTKAPEASFLIAYLYHNELKNLDSAAVAYRAFLDRFPDHEMAPSAKFELEHLGKSPEELLPDADPDPTSTKDIPT